MSDLTWRDEMPTKAGWYWIKWKDGRKSLWSFDTSDDFDSEYLKSRAVLFLGPLEPPEGDE